MWIVKTRFRTMLATFIWFGLVMFCGLLSEGIYITSNPRLLVILLPACYGAGYLPFLAWKADKRWPAS